MQVSKYFLRDFAYLANRYGRTAADIEEMNAAVRADKNTGRRYITTLAAAHRARYEQTLHNGWPDRLMQDLHRVLSEYGRRG